MPSVNVRISEETAALLDKLAATLDQSGALHLSRADAVRWCIARALPAAEKEAPKGAAVKRGRK